MHYLVRRCWVRWLHRWSNNSVPSVMPVVRVWTFGRRAWINEHGMKTQ